MTVVVMEAEAEDEVDEVVVLLLLDAKPRLAAAVAVTVKDSREGKERPLLLMQTESHDMCPDSLSLTHRAALRKVHTHTGHSRPKRPSEGAAIRIPKSTHA